MHLLTKSSQPGFIDARNRLVSSEVILPTNTPKEMYLGVSVTIHVTCRSLRNINIALQEL